MSGRPSKFTPALQSALIKHIESGCTFKDACAIEGIGVSTFNQWRREFPAFSAAIKKAEVGFKQTHIHNIARASHKHWQASAWLLECKFPNEFSQRFIKRTDEGMSIDLLAHAESLAAKYEKPPVQQGK